MPYPESFIGPMRQELTRIGVQELKTADQVDTGKLRRWLDKAPLITYLNLGSIIDLCAADEPGRFKAAFRQKGLRG